MLVSASLLFPFAVLAAYVSFGVVVLLLCLCVLLVTACFVAAVFVADAVGCVLLIVFCVVFLCVVSLLKYLQQLYLRE